MGRVPLGRRNLLQDRRRAALSVAGVAVALLLVLVLDGIFAGAMRQVTAYIRSSPADVFVSQRGVRTMHMSASALPASTVDAVRRAPGVTWAEGIGFTTTVLLSPAGRQLSYLIGYDVTSGRAGPGRIIEGNAPRRGEVVVDDLAADALDVSVGDRLTVLGTPFRVAGLSTGGTSIVNSTAFVRVEDFARLRGPAPSYVLAAGEPGISPEELARDLSVRLPDTTVQTRAELARQERAIVSDMSADVMRIMAAIGFAIALAVIGLTLFTVTLGKLREYGVVKALGAGTARLASVVVVQAAWTVVLALGAAVLAAVGLGAFIGRVVPTVQLAVEPRGVVRTALGAIVVAFVGAVVPLRRIARVDPASAFRRTT